MNCKYCDSETGKYKICNDCLQKSILIRVEILKEEIINLENEIY